jgi:uncharacterized protein (DUF433 family)
MFGNDDKLIERHIDPESLAWGAAEARLVDSGVPVWAVIGAWRVAGEDADRAAADYKLSPEAARAALAYYARHRKVIDARLTLNADFFAPLDDEPESEAERAAVAEARAELARGEGRPAEEVFRRLGL